VHGGSGSMLGWISGARTGIADALAQRPGGGFGEALHQRGQVGEVGLAADQRVQTWIDEQREREFHAATVIPARAAWRRQAADLAGLQAQAAGVEGGA